MISRRCLCEGKTGKKIGFPRGLIKGDPEKPREDRGGFSRKGVTRMPAWSRLIWRAAASQLPLCYSRQFLLAQVSQIEAPNSTPPRGYRNVSIAISSLLYVSLVILYVGAIRGLLHATQQ